MEREVLAATCDWLRALDSEIHQVGPQKLSLMARLQNAKTDLKDARLILHAMLMSICPKPTWPPRTCARSGTGTMPTTICARPPRPTKLCIITSAPVVGQALPGGNTW